MYFSSGSGRQFDASFSIYRGLPLAQICWVYYISGNDFQSSGLLASQALLPFTKSVQRHSESDCCILFPCFVVHSWYITCVTVCCTLSVSYRWEWTARHTEYSFGNGYLLRQKSDCSTYSRPEPNYYVLIGALVGGSDVKDTRTLEH
jgi:hypothetical protein